MSIRNKINNSGVSTSQIKFLCFPNTGNVLCTVYFSGISRFKRKYDIVIADHHSV